VVLLQDVVGGGIVGTVQLDLAGQANGRHRAEVIKLMVLSSARRRGIGCALMEAAEAEARSADGTLHTTAFYYKLLDPLTLPSPPRGERG
jgi:ribosomal protein S18 acetylase RimI-like enzyme